MTYKYGIQYVNFYTDGSAARKIAPVKKTTTAVLPKQRKPKRKVVYIDPVAIFGTLVAICMFVMMLCGISSLRQERAEAEAMEDYLTQLQKENKQLTKEYEESYDLEEVERTALALGMVSEEEVPHNVIEIPEEETPAQDSGTTLLTGVR